MSIASPSPDLDDEILRYVARREKRSSGQPPDPAPLQPLDPNVLGIDFRAWRRELDLGQQDAALLIGVSRVTYIKYESDPDCMPIGVYRHLISELKRLSELRGSQ